MRREKGEGKRVGRRGKRGRETEVGTHRGREAERRR